MPSRQITHITCDVDGYEEFWVEIDVTTWGHAEFMEIWTTASVLVIMNYFEPFSTDWHIINDDGVAILHPGEKSSRAVWQQTYKKLGVVTGRKLNPWFGQACLMAVTEAMSLSPKSSVNGAEGSAGASDENGTEDSAAGDSTDGVVTG